jgi:hypothetical protein
VRAQLWIVIPAKQRQHLRYADEGHQAGNSGYNTFTVILRLLDYGTATRGNQSLTLTEKHKSQVFYFNNIFASKKGEITEELNALHIKDLQVT